MNLYQKENEMMEFYFPIQKENPKCDCGKRKYKHRKNCQIKTKQIKIWQVSEKSL